MPADKYTRSLYKPGTVKAEKAAEANRDPARARAAMARLAREGTTSTSGGRSTVKMPAKPSQVVRTTVSFKPTPTGKKR